MVVMEIVMLLKKMFDKMFARPYREERVMLSLGDTWYETKARVYGNVRLIQKPGRISWLVADDDGTIKGSELGQKWMPLNEGDKQ